MATLVRNEDVPPEGLPPLVADYLAKSAAAVSAADGPRMLAAEDLFELYGPEVLMVLGMYSLPVAYASAKGVEVLEHTGYLEKRPMRRVWETAQFVVDVMSGGGLGPGGRGLRTAQKVRLMHAAIRHIVRNNPAKPWDEARFGVPINQEDLAGTLMSFSWVVLEGLRRLGLGEQIAAARESYIYGWRIVGAVMGVRPELIPATIEEAARLSRTIAVRQIAASEAGQGLTRALIDGLDGLVPLHIRFAPSAMRFFLANDPISGREDVADLLAIPAANWTEELIGLEGFTAWLTGDWARHSPFVAAFLRKLRLSYVELLLRAQRGPGRPGFRIPQRIQDLWRGR
jgi:hypothetical protein